MNTLLLSHSLSSGPFKVPGSETMGAIEHPSHPGHSATVSEAWTICAGQLRSHQTMLGRFGSGSAGRHC